MKRYFIGLVVQVLLSLAPMIALLVIHTGLDAENKPCDTPISAFIMITIILGFALSGTNLLVGLATLAKNKVEKGKPVPPGFAACLQLCVTPVAGIWMFYWWVRGNYEVWGSRPVAGLQDQIGTLTNATWPGQVPFGMGCDPDLWGLGEGWLIYTYAVSGAVTFCACCVFPCFAISKLKGGDNW